MINLFWLSHKFPKSVRLHSNLSLNVPGSQKVTLTFDLRLKCQRESCREQKDNFRGFLIWSLQPIETTQIIQMSFQNVPDIPEI